MAAAIVVCGLATAAQTIGGTAISSDALVGLYGSALGYIFGFSNGSNRPRDEWTQSEREATRMRSKNNT